MSSLSEKRQAAGYSQAGLAEASGITSSMIKDYEQGRRDIGGMGIRRAKALADALGVKIEELIEDE
jgi:transcriptional regulator with XRE-family HTH domain